MQERIFTLKAGTEVPKQFDGVTIPFQVPATLAEVQKVCDNNEATLVAIFNQAHALNVQKAVKAEAQEEGQTIEGLRKIAAEHKYGQVRVRGASTGGTRKPKAETVAAVLGDDFLSMLTPEQRKVYESKMEALRSKPTAPATTEAPVANAEKPKAKK